MVADFKRATETTGHAAAAVACPDCKRAALVWCVRPSGHRAMRLHKARLELADATFIDQHGARAWLETRNDANGKPVTTIHGARPDAPRYARRFETPRSRAKPAPLEVAMNIATPDALDAPPARQVAGGRAMTSGEFKAARRALGLSTGQLGVILDTAEQTIRKWEAPDHRSSARSPNPVACQVMRWLLAGYRPPEWPAQPHRAPA